MLYNLRFQKINIVFAIVGTFNLGCGKEGFFGENCTQQCPINCQDRRCDIITGHCRGCVPGYQGPTCDLGKIM